MESMWINQCGFIYLDGKSTSLRVTQTRSATAVMYSGIGVPPLGHPDAILHHKSIKLPHPHYTLALDNPMPLHKSQELDPNWARLPDRAQFELDLRAALAKT